MNCSNNVQNSKAELHSLGNLRESSIYHNNARKRQENKESGKNAKK